MPVSMKDEGSVDSKARYRSLILEAQELQSLWIAEHQGRALILGDSGGEKMILVWPNRETAAGTLRNQPELGQYQPVQRSLGRWLSASTGNLVEDGVLVAANPDETLRCLKVPAQYFARDLSGKPTLQGKDISRIKRTVRRAKAQ